MSSRLSMIHLVGKERVNTAGIGERTDQRAICRPFHLDGHLRILGKTLENQRAPQEFSEGDVTPLEGGNVLVYNPIAKFGQHATHLGDCRLDVMLQLRPALEPILPSEYKLSI